MIERNPWRVDDIVAATGLPQYTVRKFVRSEELVAAAKRMVRSKTSVPYYYRTAARLLYAIALEAGLKALWEIDNGREAKHTHELREVFAGLRCSRRKKHMRWYGLIADSVSASISLCEALETNSRMVKDFKYGDYDGEIGSAVGGEVVDGVVVGGTGALISYGQFVIDDLELTVSEHAEVAGELTEEALNADDWGWKTSKIDEPSR